jgi:NADPH2:quinone reductase
LALVRNFDLCGVYWGGYLAHGSDRVIRESVEQVFALFQQGAISPVVAKVFPPQRCAEAFDAVVSRSTAGKVVIDWAA